MSLEDKIIIRNCKSDLALEQINILSTNAAEILASKFFGGPSRFEKS